MKKANANENAKAARVRHERILFARASRERKKLSVNQRENE